MNVVVMKDIAGNNVALDTDTILHDLFMDGFDSFRLMGMGVREIAELLNQYHLRRGPLDITVESIKETFK